MANLLQEIQSRYDTVKVLSETSRAKVELVIRKSDGAQAVKRTEYHINPATSILYLNRFVGVPPIWHMAQLCGMTISVESYIRGQSMEHYLQKVGRIDETAARIWMIHLCEILLPLHKAGIIHRDIKPSNIILTGEGQLYLIDFETARTYDPEQKNDTVYLGTKGYAAPEQYGYAQTDARTDLYALGALISRALTGHLPGDAAYDGPLAPVLQRCMRIDPAHRYQSAQDLLAALQKGSVHPVAMPRKAPVQVSYKLQPVLYKTVQAAATVNTNAVKTVYENLTPSVSRWKSIKKSWWKVLVMGGCALLLLYLDLQADNFDLIRDRLLSWSAHSVIILPVLGYLIDFALVRSRPVYRAFSGRKWWLRALYGVIYFLLWFSLVICIGFLCGLLYSPQALQYIATQ